VEGFVAGQDALVCVNYPVSFLGIFLEELDAEGAEAGGEEAGEELGAGLGGCVVEGVAAADVNAERVLDADAVAEVDTVFLAGAAAVQEGLAGG